VSRLRSNCLLYFASLSWIVSNATAVDGVVLIDQARAMAGNVTPGDAPGFPVTITLTGSYKLSGNLTVPDGNTTAIDIRSSFVTIDLNGFSIIGPVDCSGGFPCAGKGNGTGGGILAGNPAIASRILFNITIRNGTIQGMGWSGIDMFGDSFLVENMNLRSNGADGLRARRGGFSSGQEGAIVRHVNAHLNGGTGIDVEAGVVSENTASRNSASGIYLSRGTLRQNAAFFNWIGLHLGGPVGFAGNTTYDNTTNVVGGINLGQNVCGFSLCP
jgi:hypothetical protein